MKLEPVKNSGYCANVVKIGKIVNLPNCDNVVAGIFNATQVIVSKDTKEGDIGIFIPVETKLNDEFLSFNNLNADPSLNKNKDKKGYISKGRVKCVAFRGHKSEGLFLSLDSLSYILSEKEINSLQVGDEFDYLNGKLFCEKYIVGVAQTPAGTKNVAKYTKGEKRFSRLVDNQFKFHIDTEQLKKNFHKIHPEDIISVSRKYHGTSAIAGRVLVNRKLNLLEKFAKKIGIKIQDKEYGLIYSSRGVIKNRYIETNKYYIKAKEENTGDVWDITSKQLEPIIPNGITLFYEIVGYTPQGKCIQKGYHYGAEPNKLKILIYRITNTNIDGQVQEFSFAQIKEFCNKNGLNHVDEFYYGKAKDMFPEIPVDEKWNESVLSKMVNHKPFEMEVMCSLNNNKVPAEGCVLRKDSIYGFNAFKLKSFKFLEGESKELDSGQADIETQESVKE